MKKNSEGKKIADKLQGLKSRSRRQFVNQALTISAGVAFSGFVPRLKAELMMQQPPCPGPAGCTTPAKNELCNPPEIGADSSGLLQATLQVKDEIRTVPGYTGNYRLRAYLGYKGHNTNSANLVSNPAVYSPGPTLRAPVGGKLEIALLNQINPANFPETPEGRCDVTQAPTGCQIYPGTNWVAPAQEDKAPDCFRGSNHTNLHFHGTHVSPNAFSDNVLIAIAPDLSAKAEDCNLWWKYACLDYPNPQAWQHLKDANKEVTKADQEGLIQLFRQSEARLKALPTAKGEDPQLHIREATNNETLTEYGEFPQYWRGCFPYCIRPPQKTPNLLMGQAPGTHWYHAHKHGSTSIQVFNGMAGALILEGNQPGEYDAKLKQTMPGVQQKILVIQQFANQPNMETSGGAGAQDPACPGGPGAGVAGFLINGQSVPTITMQTGEVQWWRLIDASVQGSKGKFIGSFTGGINFVQIAQDGVQFAWENYSPQIANPPTSFPTSFLLAPGNRVDILVMAPNAAGSGTLTVGGTAIVNVSVVSQGTGCNTKWPQTQADYPTMPGFLGDITTWWDEKTIKYQMCARHATPMINGKTFQEGTINESMLLNTEQQWTIQNYSTSAAGSPLHPFHIHVNPFQIVEIFDPTGSLSSLFNNKGAMFGNWSKATKNSKGAWELPAPWIWWDTFPLPLGQTSSSGSCPADKDVTPGYIVFRTRFADFAGKFVDHCHILAHEDRGMMQLIEVVDNKTVVKHH
jgi:FtsP/CotA-like multicopper oxidase with cupredoxin domain